VKTQTPLLWPGLAGARWQGAKAWTPTQPESTRPQAPDREAASAGRFSSKWGRWSKAANSAPAIRPWTARRQKPAPLLLGRRRRQASDANAEGCIHSQTHLLPNLAQRSLTGFPWSGKVQTSKRRILSSLSSFPAQNPMRFRRQLQCPCDWDLRSFCLSLVTGYRQLATTHSHFGTFWLLS